MQNTVKYAQCFLLATIFFLTPQPLRGGTPINELPMYGGAEKTTQKKKCDEEFKQSFLQTDITLEDASNRVAQIGWDFLLIKGDTKTAMKRFNQAWLLNENNPNAYWGFGAILDRQGKFEQAIEMGEKALKLDQKNPKIMSDVASSYGNKGMKEKEAKREYIKYFSTAYKLFQKAIEINHKYPIAYYQWAIILFYDENYPDSWEKIKKSQELGFDVPKDFLETLKAKIE